MKPSGLNLPLLALLALWIAPVAVLAASANFPAGTTLNGTIQQDINSKTAQDGQRFTMVTPSGSKIVGHLSEVDRANIGRKAHIKLNFDKIRFTDGTSVPLSATLVGVTQHKQVNYVQAAGQVLGGMVVGNIIGKAVGTNLGGLVGVAGGGLLAANTSTNIDIPAGAAAQIQLTEPLVVRPQARY
jgi:hypothetical protein